jgi:heavy metal sensor kinase
MTLVNRVSAFFLAALALCLAGYSASLYGLVRWQRFEAFDADLQGALHILVAAIETEEDDVKWQPTDHAISLGDDYDHDEVRWAILTDDGRVVDRSPNLRASPDDAEKLVGFFREGSLSLEPQDRGEWRLSTQRLTAPLPKMSDLREPDEFDALTVVAAKNATVMYGELWRLSILAILLPAGVWLAAAAAGRWYCRKALRPLLDMAEAARSTKQDDFSARLPVPPQADELGELGSAFNGLLDRLGRAFERQRRFVGDAAHQLRTPLTALRGSIDVTLRRDRTNDEYRQALLRAAQQTEDLQNVVTALLFLARSESDAPLVDIREVDLAKWLSQYATRWEKRPRAADITFHVESNGAVSLSPALLEQALDNLVDNALKYSEAGTPVVVTASATGAETLLSVEDRGMGIPEDARESVFEPFYRSSEARLSGVGGTGLGLALVKRIAEAHGGTATCESVAGGGSRFTIRLPRKGFVSP